MLYSADNNYYYNNLNYLFYNWPLLIIKGFFRDNERNNLNEHNSFKNPTSGEADQLAIYNHSRGVELTATKNNSS